MRRRRPIAALAVVNGFIAGCALGTEQANDVPAVIDGVTDASRAELSQAVGTMLGQPVTLANDALTRSSVLTIERVPVRDADGRRIDARERAAPEVFRLVKRGDRCILIHERTKTESILHDVRCTTR